MPSCLPAFLPRVHTSLTKKLSLTMLTFDFTQPYRHGNTSQLATPATAATCISQFSSRHSSTTQVSFRSSSMERPTKHRLSVMTDHATKETHLFLSQELDASWMGVPLILCFFTSGLIDSVAFNSWNCFVGMQTGKSDASPHESSRS